MTEHTHVDEMQGCPCILSRRGSGVALFAVMCSFRDTLILMLVILLTRMFNPTATTAIAAYPSCLQKDETTDRILQDEIRAKLTVTSGEVRPE